MTVPLKYNLRHLRVRWTSTLVTIVSIALVVAVFVMVMSLARGLRSTFLSTGDERNLLVLRKGALAESSSQITVEDVRRTRFLEGIQRTTQGEPLASAEVIVLITMDRASGGKAHVQVRGLEPAGAFVEAADQAGGRADVPARRSRMYRQPQGGAALPTMRPGRKLPIRQTHLARRRHFRSRQDGVRIRNLGGHR